MMKRLLLLLLLVLPAVLRADNVSRQRAQALAERFFERRGIATRSGSVVLRWDGEPEQTRSSAEPAFYLYTHSAGGFVIVAGDDCVEPILGYSTDGTYDASNLNMRNWMLEIRNGINYLRSQGREAAPGIRAQWSDGSAAQTRAMTTRSSKLYETAAWDQETPYNNSCPTLNGKKVYTGCVATATAIAMRYHKYPSSGTGALPGYTYKDENGASHTINDHALGHTYDWESMPLTNGGQVTWTDAQKKAVAQLMKDCGVMLKMNYNVVGSSGSAAYTSDVPAGLVRYMKYDASMYARYRNVHTHNDWIAMVRRNLDEFGPTIYGGQSKEGGHCFVLDGYNDKGDFHINWGWGGSGNGYFAFPDFDGFNTWHEAVFGMKSDAGGTAAPMIGLWYDDENKGITISTENIVRNVAFTFKVDYIYNIGSADFTGPIAFALADKDNKVKEILYSANYTLNPSSGGYITGYSIQPQSVMITQAIAPGDRLKIFYSNGLGTTDWKPVCYGDEEGMVGEIILARPIDENTSFAYSADSRIIEVNTLAGVACKLADAQNSEVEITTDTSVTDRTVLKIDTRKLAAGTYRLTIQNENGSKTIDFTVGGDK